MVNFCLWKLTGNFARRKLRGKIDNIHLKITAEKNKIGKLSEQNSSNQVIKNIQFKV